MKHMLENKYNKLKQIIMRIEKVTVAFSGGVDSTFLLKVCFDLLGEKVLAVTARSEIIPKRELKNAEMIAGRIGVKHVVFDFLALSNKKFVANLPDRCFICKSELFGNLKKIAEKYDYMNVVDGNNADDALDFRPGQMASKKLGIISPLDNAKLTKDEIRFLSKRLDLPTWNQPAFSCLSSRFPYYTEITSKALRQVEKAEDFLLRLGMKIFRVRHHNDIARIELGKDEMRLLWEMDLSKKINKYFKFLGYTYVTIDLQEYQTGRMNEVLTNNDLAFMKDDKK